MTDKPKTTFVSLFKKSVITQSLLAILIVGTICVLALRDLTVPAEIYGLGTLILGFFFGSKVQNSINGR